MALNLEYGRLGAAHSRNLRAQSRTTRAGTLQDLVKTGQTVQALDLLPAFGYVAGMFNAQFIDDLTRRVSAALPPGLGVMQRDIEHTIRAALQGAFARMDLVTREEFEAQRAVLARTRAKLESLEARMEALEKD